MRWLIDMDGVLADFEKAVLDQYIKRYPNRFFVPLEKRSTFYIKQQYPKEEQPLIEEIYLAKGFYLNLQPIEGSLEVLLELSNMGEVYICTSPLSENPYCIQEKYEWTNKHLGKEWAKKIIVTKDKTIVQGNFLIDDNPEVIGVQEPAWEHILYSQPYNLHVTSKRRLTWNNWREVFGF